MPARISAHNITPTLLAVAICFFRFAAKSTMPSPTSNGMPVVEFVVDLSALPDVIVPALGDNLLVVAEDIRRGDKRRRKK